jgi:multicomponent Na+:H+ antiporter subunit F
MNHPEWLTGAMNGALLILTASMFLAFIRLLKGPSLCDRVVALDLMTTLTIGFVGVYAMLSNQPVLLMTGIAIALIAFLGTMAFAYYIERRGKA